MARILDNVRNMDFDESRVRECPNPKIIAKYGKNGKCFVSVYTCMCCKKAVHYKYTSAISCGYGKKEVSSDASKGAKNQTE